MEKHKMKKYRFRAWLALLCFAFTAPCSLLPAPCSYASEDPLAVFNEANAAYEKSDFPKAITLYESLAASGRANALLYYNLGNAYYRNQQPGRALVNYERAFRLSPRDADIRHNLEFVRAQVQEPAPRAMEQFAGWLSGLVSLNGLTIACSAFFMLLIAGLTALIFRKNRSLLLANITLFLLFVVSAGWLALKINREVSTRRAIVTSGPAEVRNGPGADNSVGFTLPEGRTVVILGQKDEWLAVGLRAEGLKGWVEKKYIEEI